MEPVDRVTRFIRVLLGAAINMLVLQSHAAPFAHAEVAAPSDALRLWSCRR